VTLPALAVDAALEEIVRWGRKGVETGAVFLGSGTDVDVLAVPRAEGIVRRRDQFGVSGTALAQLFEWADEEGRTVLALVHSHRGRAWLSPVDLKHGFSVPGFVTAVVPRYRDPPAAVAEWGWWRYEEEGWRTSAPPTIVDRACLRITFDGGGVRA